MKKLLLLGSIVLVLGLLIAGSTAIFAHGPDDSEAIAPNGEAWSAMHEACINGDWEKMAEAAKEFHGEDFEYMPHHGYYDRDHRYGHNHQQYGWGGHMGRGMMGW